MMSEKIKINNVQYVTKCQVRVGYKNQTMLKFLKMSEFITESTVATLTAQNWI